MVDFVRAVGEATIITGALGLGVWLGHRVAGLSPPSNWQVSLIPIFSSVLVLRVVGQVG
jgi:hypothetical protein